MWLASIQKQILPSTMSKLETITALAIQNLQIAGYFFKGTRKKFLYVEGITAWLNDCPQFVSTLYEVDELFDYILIYYQGTVIYIDPISRQ